MVQLALLIAIQVILTATPLGFIQISPALSITLMHLPVLVGAVSMGPMAGGILGGVFGLSSMIVASTRPGLLDALFFSPFYSGAPLQSIILCMVPRILFGLLAAWLFRLLVKVTGKRERLSAGIAAGVATLFHSVSVLGLVYIMFGPKYAEAYGISYGALLGAMGVVIGTNGLLEAAAAILVCVALVKPLRIVQQGKA